MELSDEQKKFLSELARFRSEKAVRLGRIWIKTDQERVQAFYDFFDSWCRVVGKDGAVDLLLFSMRKAHEALREAYRQTHTKRNGKVVLRDRDPSD